MYDEQELVNDRREWKRFTRSVHQGWQHSSYFAVHVVAPFTKTSEGTFVAMDARTF